MTWPASLTLVTVTHSPVIGGQKPAGHVKVEPASRMWATTDGASVLPAEFELVPVVDGTYTFQVPAVDDENLTGADLTYWVTELFPGGSRRLRIAPTLAHAAAPVDLYEVLTEAPIPGGTQAFIDQVQASLTTTFATKGELSEVATGDPITVTDVSMAAVLEDPATATGAALIRQIEPGGNFVQYVDIASGVDTARGRSWAKPKRTLQAAVDALPVAGGTIYVAPGEYAPFTTTKTGIKIVGSGATGQDGTVGRGATVIDASAAPVVLGGTGSQDFRGFTLRDLHVRGAAGAVAGIQVNAVSNFLIDHVTASNFPDGAGFLIQGANASQYGTMRDSSAFDCKVGIDVVDHNGLRIFGGTIENLTGPAAIPAGTSGIIARSGSDSLRAYGVVTQFLETAYDLTGENAYVEGARCEVITTGVVFRGRGGTLGPGCSFSNHIAGTGTGTPVRIESTASRTRVNPFAYANFAPRPVSDAAPDTLRLDAILVRASVPLINATTTVPLGVVTAGTSRVLANVRLVHQGVAPGTTYANRWMVTASGRNGYVESYTTDWLPGQVYQLFGQATGSDQARAINTPATVTFTKNGAVTDLTNVMVEAELHPY